MSENDKIVTVETSYVYRIPERPWRSRCGGPLIGSRRLESLRYHDRRAHANFMVAASPCPNGIACPECGKELWDSTPMKTTTSYPPKMAIHCGSCDYRGYRVA